MAREMFSILCQLLAGPGQSMQTVAHGAKGVLAYLTLRGGSATPTEISRSVGVSTARVTNVLNVLERKGCVVRTPVPGDRRRVQVTITDTGRGLYDRCAEAVTGRIAGMLEALGDRDAEECIRLCRRISELCRSGRLSTDMSDCFGGTVGDGEEEPT
jgi:DNA-binding MarR family transcriptional regulator